MSVPGILSASAAAMSSPDSHTPTSRSLRWVTASWKTSNCASTPLNRSRSRTKRRCSASGGSFRPGPDSQSRKSPTCRRSC